MQSVIVSVPGTALVLRNIGGREGERERRGARPAARPQDSPVSRRPHCHRHLCAHNVITRKMARGSFRAGSSRAWKMLLLFLRG